MKWLSLDPRRALFNTRRTLFDTRHAFLAAGAVALTLVCAPVAFGDEQEDVVAEHVQADRCARQFEKAQRTDMESFRDYDAKTFRDNHHPNAITVFASGAVRIGIDNIMAALDSHFKNREAIWAWTEVYRIVDGCKAAYIVYNATYDIPSIGYHQRTLTGVSYTYDKRKQRWLTIADRGTFLERPAQ